jgi:long-chain acyl-CoA synthetase
MWVRRGIAVIDPQQCRWLQPLGPFLELCSRVFYALVWVTMRLLFRIESRGLPEVPTDTPFIITPNHTSSLDPFVLAAVLPYRLLRTTRWAANRPSVLRNPIFRFVNRIARTMPLERNLSALAAAAAVIDGGDNLIWFPEGKRSACGRLQTFKPGIGALMAELDVPAVPVLIQGAHRALPPDRIVPRCFRRIRVTFGKPVYVQDLQRNGEAPNRQHQRIASSLQDRVAGLMPSQVSENALPTRLDGCSPDGPRRVADEPGQRESDSR